MSALTLLIAAVRTALIGLRALVSSLEAAVDQAEAHVIPSASGSPRPSSDWDVVSAVESSRASRPSTFEDYDAVASNIPGPSPAALELAARLSGSGESKKARIVRAWEAGCWAKATIEGRIPKPRPTPKCSLQSTCYVVVRAPSVDHPVRVSSATEYFRLVPRFTEGSISHSFPSISEGKAYCLALGIDFPAELKEQ